MSAPFQMDLEVLGTILQRFQDDRNILHVRSINKGAGLPKGENYLSIITKLEAEVILGSGRKSKRKFVMKSIPEGEETQKIQEELGVFKQEIKMYSVVLKEMEYLMDEFQDTNDPVWCDVIYFKPYTSILLEDLNEKGFKIMNRKDNLDLAHARITLRSIARFHAMCKILEKRGIISEKDFNPYLLISDEKFIKLFIGSGIKVLRETMLQEWGPEWTKVAEKLNIPMTTLVEKMKEMSKVDESRFNVLNHGDCWTANMMFKHDSDGKPIAHRLLDFQVCHYNSFIYDVLYFIFGSVKYEVRQDSFNLLLETYHSELKETLLRYNYTEHIPEMAEIHSEVKRITNFKLATVLVYAITTTEGTDLFDLEKTLLTEGSEGISPILFRSDKFKEEMGPVLLEIVEML